MTERYIPELLLEHDCVIIPGFGGFVARSSPAFWAKSERVLMPPYKSIVFNKNLSANDGLLAGHIMQKENVPYQQAFALIERFVSHCTRQLELHKRYELTGLGILYKNSENTLLFEQDMRVNYLSGSFGLPALHLVKIVQEEKTMVQKPELIYRQAATIPVKKPQTIQRIAIASSVLILITALLFISTKQNPFENAMATFSPFRPKNGELFTASSLKSFKKLVVPPLLLSRPDTVVTDKMMVVQPLKEAEWDKQPYQIVLGCFAIEQNANKLVTQLEKEHITAALAGKNKKNLYVVSVGAYADEKSARKKLLEIKSRFPAAWLFKR